MNTIHDEMKMLSTNIAQVPSTNQATSLIASNTKVKPVIDLSDSLADITANIIHDSEHFQLPSEIFESIILKAINDLVDDFAINPDKYLKPQHQRKIDEIAREYLNS